MHTLLANRILARCISSDSGCLLWQGGRTSKGYGAIYLGGRQYFVHRVMYEASKGPIPDGLHVDHLCRVRHCCKPEHLEAVTCRENLLRGAGITARNAAATHCPHGHPYSGDNLIIYFRKGIKERACRTCKRAQDRASRTRKRSAIA